MLVENVSVMLDGRDSSVMIILSVNYTISVKKEVNKLYNSKMFYEWKKKSMYTYTFIN